MSITSLSEAEKPAPWPSNRSPQVTNPIEPAHAANTKAGLSNGNVNAQESKISVAESSSNKSNLVEQTDSNSVDQHPKDKTDERKPSAALPQDSMLSTQDGRNSQTQGIETDLDDKYPLVPKLSDLYSNIIEGTGTAPTYGEKYQIRYFRSDYIRVRGNTHPATLLLSKDAEQCSPIADMFMADPVYGLYILRLFSRLKDIHCIIENYDTTPQAANKRIEIEWTKIECNNYLSTVSCTDNWTRCLTTHLKLAENRDKRSYFAYYRLKTMINPSAGEDTIYTAYTTLREAQSLFTRCLPTGFWTQIDVRIGLFDEFMDDLERVWKKQGNDKDAGQLRRRRGPKNEPDPSAKNEASDHKSSFSPSIGYQPTSTDDSFKTTFRRILSWSEELWSDIIRMVNYRGFIKFALHESTVRIITTLLLLASLTFAIIAVYQSLFPFDTYLLDDNFFSNISQAIQTIASIYLTIVPIMYSNDLRKGYSFWFRLCLVLGAATSVAFAAVYPFQQQLSIAFGAVSGILQVLGALQLVECILAAIKAGVIGGMEMKHL